MENQLTVTSLSGAQGREALRFLASRAVRTAYLRGLIRDHGVNSPLNRGDFYACVGEGGEVRGVALLGHATVIEVADDAAAAAFARFALRLSCPRIIRGERRAVRQFWREYQSGGEIPHRLNQELLLAQRMPLAGGQPAPGLRAATAEDLPLLAEVNAGLIRDEGGANPLERDPAGFRRRLLERVERGRVWLWRESGRLIFKTDVLAETAEAAYIEGVYVAPEERGHGVGVRCLARLGALLLERSRAVCLTVNESKEAALSLYRKAGYDTDCEYATVHLSPAGEAAAA